MAKTKYSHLSTRYLAACVSFQQATGVQRQIALDRANGIWNRFAEQVTLRAIAAASRLRGKR